MTNEEKVNFNLQIINVLTKLIDKYPYLTFGNILDIFAKGSSNRVIYDEDPDITFYRIEARIKDNADL